VRFATEIQGVKTVLTSDINQKACNLANHNVHLNGLTERVMVQHEDANRLLSCYSAPNKRFDVVDVDPFGSPVPYLDSAIRALRNNGLLAVTATDMAPLCGVHAKACIRKYGGKPLRTEYCQELAVRLLAGCVATLAAKHDIGIRVVFSHCSDHYVRVYAEVGYGATKGDKSVKNLGYVLHCFNCLHRETVKKPFTKCIEQCPECGSKMDYAGPLWLEKIFDKRFCESMMKENTHKTFRNSGKISKLLSVATGEVEAPMTYFVLDTVSSKLALQVPTVDALLNILRENNFQAHPTHFSSRGIRTDAPALTMQKFLQKIVAGT
jgi:tRNA (guanine26-N2/guanine27-N2)-dimethyltransferase